MTPENQSSLNLVTTELIVDQLLGFFTEKNQQGGWRHTFLKTPWKFLFLYFIPGNSRQNKAPPLEIPQNCVRSLGNSNSIEGQKPRPLEIPHYFFGAIALSYPPFCYWWLIMKKGSWNLYRSPNNPNPKGGGYESAIPIAPPFFLGHPWKFHFTFY